MTPSLTAAITSIPTDAWVPIKYPNAIFDEDEQRWVSDAEVAEVEHVPCRLVVRRVKRLQPVTGDGSEQAELFATYRHHAFITNSTLGVVEAEQRHRDHALVEQVIAELKDGPLAHLPSGKYAANAAWVAHAVIAFNTARATAVAAAMRTARWATLRTKIINSPAGSRPPADASSCTCPGTGHGHRAGSCCGRPRPDHHPPPRSDRPAREGTTEDRSGRSRRDRRSRRALTHQPADSDPESANRNHHRRIRAQVTSGNLRRESVLCSVRHDTPMGLA